MQPIATIGNLIEVTPEDDVQFWADAESDWVLIEDLSPFRFTVAGEFVYQGGVYGVYGPVESGRMEYLGMICNLFLRHENNWLTETTSSASFTLAPSVARRNKGFDKSEISDLPFYYSPEGILVEGYPQASRYGRIEVVFSNQN